MSNKSNVPILSMKSFARNMNNLTFTDYYTRLMLLARAVFKWENLPNMIDEKWIEKFLFSDGRCMFFKDEKLGFMVTQANDAGSLNMYDEPVELTPFGTGYVYSGNPLKVRKECVLIRNNDEMVPTSFSLKLFAYRLADISRTIDINVAAQKTPCVLTGSEKQKLSLKTMFNHWNGFEPAIFGDKGLESTPLKVLKTDAPIVFPQLQVQKQAVWNEALTFLGINNANTEKRERLITDEVEANDVHIELSAQCMLKAREQAAEEINNLFNTNIKVRMRTSEELQSVMKGENHG